jgi:phytoene dehydrogenase-like protein
MINNSSYDFDVIIIGAGISGLVCGCYLAKRGCKTLIVEKHDKTGGYCTSFKRKGYNFDAAIHYIGSVKRGVLSRILEELELDAQDLFTQFDPTDKIILPNKVLYIRSQSEDTLSEFIKIFPKQKNQIIKFFEFISAKNFFTIYTKIKNLTFKDILDNYYQDEELKEIFIALLANMGTSPDIVSAVNAIIFFREFILDPGYYPMGGMQSLSNRFAKLFENLGGTIILNNEVKHILLKDNSTQGVMLEDEKIISSRYVISNADASETYSRLVNNRRTKEKNNITKLSATSSCCALYLGLRAHPDELLMEKANIWKINSHNILKDLKNLKESILSNPLPFGVIYSPSLHDQTAKKTTIQVLVNAPYETEMFWSDQKEEIFLKMLNLAKNVIPAIKDKNIEISIGATPITFKAYTYNTGGAIYGWEKTINNLNGTLVPQRSSIDNLFLTGHWITSGGGGGGISGVAAIGRSTSRIVLEKMDLDWPWETYIFK